MYEPTIDNTNVETMQLAVTDGRTFTELQPRDTITIALPRQVFAQGIDVILPAGHSQADVLNPLAGPVAVPAVTVP